MMNRFTKGMTTLSKLGLILLLLFPSILIAQDSISVDDIERFSYTFDIVNGKFVGDGADIIADAVEESHIMMLGNNSRNKMEEELDQALFSLLNENDYKHMIMEVGPESGKVLDALATSTTDLVNSLNSLNKKYFFEVKDLDLGPIPDFKYLGVAQLLDRAKKNQWSFIGMGVESWTSYRLLIDELFNNLSSIDQKVHQDNYQKSQALLASLYPTMNGQTYDDLGILTSGIRASKALTTFLNDMSAYPANRSIVESLQFSMDYWWLYANKGAFEKNRLSNLRNKSLLKTAVHEHQIDFEKDKLFAKMWRGHLVNGVTRNGFYGLGNTLKELTAYHGHKSINIGVLGRYTMVDGEIHDILEGSGYIAKPHRPFLSLGKKDEWVLIDLRPFNKEFHWGSYHVTKDIHVMMTRYDMIIIPKTDNKAAVNY